MPAQPGGRALTLRSGFVATARWPAIAEVTRRSRAYEAELAIALRRDGLNGTLTCHSGVTRRSRAYEA
jgi:hypothetical protein